MSTTSIIPSPRYRKTDLIKFPHFGIRDAEILSLWLKSLPDDKYVGFDYDIKVGKYAEDSVTNTSPQARLEAGTLAKRIDCVAFHTPIELDIIEVKANKIHSALGQLLSYNSLFKTTYPILKVKDLIIVTAYNDVELVRFAQSYGVKVFVL
jgi:hypothetical protein